MARSRNIKPGFFKNEDLAELPFEVRLLFIGLWTLADREGRMDDRPKRIKGELLPYDSSDVDSMLKQLQDKGFIVRYEVSGVRFLQVVNFVKHQDPHYKEKASEIPPPPGASNLIKATGITRETRARILERDGYRCRQCGSEDYLSVDHVVPASRGGSSEDSNLQVLCLKCNGSKGNKLPGDEKGARRSKHADTSLQTRGDVGSMSGQGRGDDPGSVPLIPDSLIPDSPPTPRRGRGAAGVHEFPPGFEALWAEYPRKAAKDAAAKAFAKLRPDEPLQATLIAAVKRQRDTADWRKDGGRFVPHLASWLNGRRWEDDGGAAPGGDIFAGAL